jgi:RNA polymerase sigma-70 factor (ECF subfamily)
MPFFRSPRATEVRGTSHLAVVRVAPEGETDEALVLALRARAPGAAARLYDRYVDTVHGLIFRLLGPSAELEDLVQEVFVAVVFSIDRLRDPSLLRSWTLGIAVRSAKGYLRRKKRARWLTFLPTEQLPERAIGADESHRELVREVFALLDQLPAEERIALVIHRVEGMSLSESAVACGTSLATFKRRLARAESRFFAGAEKRPALAEWLERGGRHAD